MTLRRQALVAGLAAIVAGPASSQGTPSPTARQEPPARFWFDPAQLPSFTGVVERYLINPEGKTDRLLFREGPQVIFPEHVAADIEAAVRPGHSILVYGIRARRAPVITMLAWARDGDSPPNFIDRPTWVFPEFRAADERLEVVGEIRAPLLTPQGDVIGAILEEGIVVRVPPRIAAALGDRLSAGRQLAASGRGASVPGKAQALDADRVGESRERLEALPAPVERRP